MSLHGCTCYSHFGTFPRSPQSSSSFFVSTFIFCSSSNLPGKQKKKLMRRLLKQDFCYKVHDFITLHRRHFLARSLMLLGPSCKQRRTSFRDTVNATQTVPFKGSVLLGISFRSWTFPKTRILKECTS